MPNLVAYDLAGVQPMSGPTGLIFAMRSRYTNQMELKHSSTKQILHSLDRMMDNNTTGDFWCCFWYGYYHKQETTPVLNPTGSADQLAYNVGQGMRTDAEEPQAMQQVSVQRDGIQLSRKFLVTAKSRALKAEYSLELAQDIKAIHGLNAEAELQTFSPLRFLQRSTVKSFEPSTRPLSKVLPSTPQLLVSSTSTSTPTVVGLLRSSRVYSSKSSAMQTRLHRELVEERATSSCALQTLHPHCPCMLAYLITPLHSTQTST